MLSAGLPLLDLTWLGLTGMLLAVSQQLRRRIDAHEAHLLHQVLVRQSRARTGIGRCVAADLVTLGLIQAAHTVLAEIHQR